MENKTTPTSSGECVIVCLLEYVCADCGVGGGDGIASLIPKSQLLLIKVYEIMKNNRRKM